MNKYLMDILLAKMVHTQQIGCLVTKQGEFSERVTSVNSIKGLYAIFNIRFTVEDIEEITISPLYIKIYLNDEYL